MVRIEEPPSNQPGGRFKSLTCLWKVLPQVYDFWTLIRAWEYDHFVARSVDPHPNR